MEIILIRHAETEENKKGFAQGQLNGILSLSGISEAKKIGKKLARENIDIIFSSDLQRARDTAKIINQNIGANLKFSRKLRERNFGKFQGKKYPKNWNYLIWDDEFAKKNEIESFDSMRARVFSFLNHIKKNYGDKKILIVTHKRVIQIFHIILKNYSIEKIRSSNIPRNLEIFKFKV